MAGLQNSHIYIYTHTYIKYFTYTYTHTHRPYSRYFENLWEVMQVGGANVPPRRGYYDPGLRTSLLEMVSI